MDNNDNDLCEYLIVNELSKSQSTHREAAMNKVDRIKELKELLDSGAINEDEYRSLKSEVLNQSSPNDRTNRNNGAADKWVQLEEKKFNYGIVTGIIGIVIFLLFASTMCNQMNRSSRMMKPPMNFPQQFP